MNILKLIVATNSEELSRLEDLFDRGIANNVPDLKMISSEKIKEIEPNCVVSRKIEYLIILILRK